MPNFLTNRNSDTPEETALTPSTGANELANISDTTDSQTPAIPSSNESGARKETYIDLEDDEYVEVEIVQDIDAVGGSWEQTHKENATRPAAKGRPEYKTQKQRLRELEEAYKKAKAELDKEWAAYAKKKKALDKKRKKAAKKNNKLIAVEYAQKDFIGDYPDIVEEKLMNVGFTGICFEPIKDVRAYNRELLDVVENVAVNSVLTFKPEDLFQYDCSIVIHYHAKARLEIPFSPAGLKKMSIDEVESALSDAGFCEIKKTEVPRSGFGLLKKPGRIESFKVSGDPLAVEHQTAEFDEPIEITYYAKG